MIRKTEWTVPEVKEWYLKNKENKVPIWDGILYQGTNDKFHHFITRVYDEWVYMKINIDELNLEDERPYTNISTRPLGYYFVDPINNFIKIRDYKNVKANGN